MLFVQSHPYIHPPDMRGQAILKHPVVSLPGAGDQEGS
jgi:hypothetical protein